MSSQQKFQSAYDEEGSLSGNSISILPSNLARFPLPFSQGYSLSGVVIVH
jgi:hypothetical protein